MCKDTKTKAGNELRKIYFSFFIAMIFSFVLIADGTLNVFAQESKGGPSREPASVKDNEEEPLYLGEIVITATKSKHALDDVSFHSSVVNMDNVTMSGNQNIQDVLKRLAGVYVERSAPAMGGFGLRGLGNNQGHTLILLDGMRMNEGYSGSTILENIPLEDVERIEVIRGPNSALYGANAMGGVINVITRKPAERKFTLDTDFGTYATTNYNLSYSEKFPGGFGFRLGYNRTETDGYVCNFKYQAITVDNSKPVDSIGAVYNPIGSGNYALTGEIGARSAEDDNIRLEMSYEAKPGREMGVRYIRSGFEYEYEPGRGYITDLNGNPTASSTVYVGFPGDPNVYKITGANRTGNWLNGPSAKKNNQYQFYYNTRAGENTDLRFELDSSEMENWYNGSISSTATTTSGSGQHNYREEKDISLRTEGAWHLDKHLLTGGIELRRYELDNGTWNIAFWKDVDRSGRQTKLQRGKVGFRSVFLQDEIAAADGRWLITPGFRYDHWRVYDGESLTASGTVLVPADPGNYPMPARTKSKVSPKIGLLYKPGGNVNWRANYGQAFNPPSTYDMFGTWVTSSGTIYRSNPALDPEMNTAWDLGADYTSNSKKFSLRTTYFNNILTDVITSVTVSTGPTIKQKENFGKVVIRGVEMDIGYAFNNRLTADLNVTNQGSMVKSAPPTANAVGREYPHCPNLMYNIGLQYKRGRSKGRELKLNLNLGHMDKVHDEDDNSDNHSHVFGEYDEYTLLDFAFEYRLKKNKRFFMNIDNLLDEHYYQSFLAPGRAVSAGLKLEF